MLSSTSRFADVGLAVSQKDLYGDFQVLRLQRVEISFSVAIYPGIMFISTIALSTPEDQVMTLNSFCVCVDGNLQPKVGTKRSAERLFCKFLVVA